MNETSTAGGQHMTAENRSWAVTFFTIWTGQALSLVGSRMGGFALVWWLTQASGGSATVLATSSLAAMLQGVFLGPIAGALTDRWSRRHVMIVADGVVALFSAWLGVMAWMGTLQIWHIYLAVFVRALGGTFHYAAMQAATSLMVPNDQLSRLSGMNQGLRGVMSILTPPLGALAMSVMPLQAIMAIDVVTAAFAIGPLSFVHVPEPERRPGAEDAHLVRGLARDIREGFVYIWRWQGMFIVLVVAALLNAVINPAMSLMPILIKSHFGGGALQLGWAESAWGLGMIIGGVTLSVWGGFKHKILTSMMGLIVAGLSFATVGIVPSTGLNMALSALFIAGVSNVFINGPFFAILQSVVVPRLQGRVFTTVQSLAGLAAPIGMAISGPLSDAFGVQLWFIISGLISLAWGVGLQAFPSVMHLEEHGREVQSATAVPAEEVELAAPRSE